MKYYVKPPRLEIPLERLVVKNCIRQQTIEAVNKNKMIVKQLTIFNKMVSEIWQIWCQSLVYIYLHKIFEESMSSWRT